MGFSKKISTISEISCYSILEAKGTQAGGSYPVPAGCHSLAGEFGTSSQTGGSVSRKTEPQVRALVFRCCHNLLYSISRAVIVPPGELCGIEQPGSSPGP